MKWFFGIKKEKGISWGRGGENLHFREKNSPANSSQRLRGKGPDLMNGGEKKLSFGKGTLHARGGKKRVLEVRRAMKADREERGTILCSNSLFGGGKLERRWGVTADTQERGRGNLGGGGQQLTASKEGKVCLLHGTVKKKSLQGGIPGRTKKGTNAAG